MIVQLAARSLKKFVSAQTGALNDMTHCKPNEELIFRNLVLISLHSWLQKGKEITFSAP